MAINFFNSDNIELRLNKNEIIKRFEKIAFFEHFKIKQLNFIFVLDKEILLINNKYLKHSYPTDVISFDYSEAQFLEGDLFVSIDSILINSKKFSIKFKDELYRVMIHGLLHLMKFNDKTLFEIKVIRRKEFYYLRLFSNL